MTTDGQAYLREVQYRAPDRLAARALLHTRYGRGDWFAWLADHIPFRPGGSCLDVGCGAGAFWRNAPPAVPGDMAVHLVDLSKGMVEAAMQAVAEAGRWQRVTGQVADAARLPVASGSIDTVIAIHMLYHLSDPATGVREMARVLAPGGTAAIVLNPAGTMAELTALVDRALDRTPGTRREPLTSDDALVLLRQHFADVRLVRFEDDLSVSDPADLLAYLLSLPIADDPDAPDRLADTVAAAFAGKAGPFLIGKAADLLLCHA